MTIVHWIIGGAVLGAVMWYGIALAFWPVLVWLHSMFAMW